MENNNTKLDIVNFIKQTVDAVANDVILKSMEEAEGEYGVALIKMFNEYGIYGMRIYEFMNAFEALNRLYGRTGEE